MPPDAPEGWLPPSAEGGDAPPRWRPDPGAPAPARPPARPSAPAGPSDPRGAIAVGAGAVGLLLLVLSLGLGFLLALPCCIAAWLLGARARRAPGAPAAGGTARVGELLGKVGVALCVVAMATWVVLTAVGVTPEEVEERLRRNLEEQREAPRERSDPAPDARAQPASTARRAVDGRPPEAR